MIRDADGWEDTRERLREVVDQRGANAVAREVPCNRVTLFRLLNGTTKAPAHPTQACIERYLDDRDMGLEDG